VTYTTEDYVPKLTRRDVHLIVRGREIVESGDLRRVRETLGMSRPEMAALLGISWTTLRAWEFYGSVPRPEKAIHVAKVIGDLCRAIDEERATTS
jgi:DNA-binding transcriptional regulator YiaG